MGRVATGMNCKVNEQNESQSYLDVFYVYEKSQRSLQKLACTALPVLFQACFEPMLNGETFHMKLQCWAGSNDIVKRGLVSCEKICPGSGAKWFVSLRLPTHSVVSTPLRIPAVSHTRCMPLYWTPTNTIFPSCSLRPWSLSSTLIVLIVHSTNSLFNWLLLPCLETLIQLNQQPAPSVEGTLLWKFSCVKVTRKRSHATPTQWNGFILVVVGLYKWPLSFSHADPSIKFCQHKELPTNIYPCNGTPCYFCNWLNGFTPKLKRYILPTRFHREIYNGGSENW